MNEEHGRSWNERRFDLVCAALTGITQGLNAEALTDVQYRMLARRAVRFADEVMKEIHK